MIGSKSKRTSSNSTDEQIADPIAVLFHGVFALAPRDLRAYRGGAKPCLNGVNLSGPNLLKDRPQGFLFVGLKPAAAQQKKR